jgi:topoisomerase-4 subunit A
MPRGNGEPISGRVNPPDGASFKGVMLGEPENIYLVASDAGYGFKAKLEDLYTKNRNGKAVLTVPKDGLAIAPAQVISAEEGFIAAVSSTGRMLVMDMEEFPVLGKGKGLKIMQIPPAKLKAREEYMVAVACFNEGDSLIINTEKRHITLKPEVIDNYYGERGRRGLMLPKGFRQVTRISVERIQEEEE